MSDFGASRSGKVLWHLIGAQMKVYSRKKELELRLNKCKQQTPIYGCPPSLTEARHKKKTKKNKCKKDGRNGGLLLLSFSCPRQFPRKDTEENQEWPETSPHPVAASLHRRPTITDANLHASFLTSQRPRAGGRACEGRGARHIRPATRHCWIGNGERGGAGPRKRAFWQGAEPV